MVLVPDGGTVLVLDVWATYSSACVQSAPFLTAVQSRFPPPQVVLLGVTTESAAAARPYVEEMGPRMDYRVACDPGGTELSKIIGSQMTFSLPRTFVFDRMMKVCWSGSPLSEGLQEAIESAGGTAMAPFVPVPGSSKKTGDSRGGGGSGTGGFFSNMVDSMDQLLGGENKETKEEEERRRKRERERRAAAARGGQQDEGTQLGRPSVRHAPGAVVPSRRPALLEGWLYKKGRLSLVAPWKRRFFRQSGVYVYYFRHEGDNRPRSRIHLGELQEVSKRYHSQMGPCLGVVVPERLYLLSPGKNCPVEDLREWYDGFVGWQKWLEAHPNDEVPEAGEIVYEPRQKKNVLDQWGDSIANMVSPSSSSSSGQSSSSSSKRQEKETQRQDRGQANEVNEPWREDTPEWNKELERAEREKSSAKQQQQQQEKQQQQQRREEEEREARQQQQEQKRRAEEEKARRAQAAQQAAEQEEKTRRKEQQQAKSYAATTPAPAPAPIQQEVQPESLVRVRTDTKRAEKEAEQRTVEARMTRSAELDLSMMGLQRLPFEWMMGLRAIRFMDLSFNHFSAWPEEALAPHCDNLEMLIMGGCQLPSMPPSIGRFTALKELVLNGNKFTSLPNELGACQQLTKFNVANNQLRSLPSSLGWLYRLEELHISGNPIGRLPDSIGNLRMLQVMDANTCSLNAVPDELVYCTQLMDLNLMNNNLIRLPSRVGWLIRCVTLNVSGNASLKDVPLSMGLCEGLAQIGLGLNLSHCAIEDREMMKQFTIGADRLYEYLERRMMASGFDQRATMSGFPASWPYIPMEPVRGASAPGQVRRPQSSVSPRQKSSSTLGLGSMGPEAALNKYGGASLAAQNSNVPAPAAAKQPSKLDQVRTAVETIITRDIMPVVSQMRGELLDPKHKAFSANSNRVKLMRPEAAALISTCGISFKIPKPQFKPGDDDKEKQMRLLLLFHLKEIETTLEETKNHARKADAKLLAEIAKIVRQMKAAAIASV